MDILELPLDLLLNFYPELIITNEINKFIQNDLEHLSSYCSRPVDNFFHLSTIDLLVVGYSWTILDPKTNLAHLKNIHVDHDHRQKGIAKKLISDSLCLSIKNNKTKYCTVISGHGPEHHGLQRHFLDLNREFNSRIKFDWIFSGDTFPKVSTLIP